MSFLQFNPDGSLKLTEEQSYEKEREKQSIIITREQISTKPAKAQIRIRFPEKVENPRKVFMLYDNLSREISSDAMHKIEQINEQTFIIKIDNGSWSMYTTLDFLVRGFKEALSINNQSRIILKGAWAGFHRD
jgi:hypothetical protein